MMERAKSNVKRRLNIERSFTMSRLNKEHIASAYELVVPRIVELTSQPVAVKDHQQASANRQHRMVGA